MTESMIFLLHIALSVSSLALSPVLFISRWHASFHLVFGHPLFLFNGISGLNTFLSMCSSSRLIACPYQFNRFSVLFWKPASLMLTHVFFPDLIITCHSEHRLHVHTCLPFRIVRNYYGKAHQIYGITARGRSIRDIFDYGNLVTSGNNR